MFGRKSAVVAKKHLDYILSTAKYDAPLSERIAWLSDLLTWIRKEAEGIEGSALRDDGKVQAARIRFVFQVMTRNPQWKKQVAKTLRSVIRDTDAIELFSHLGLPTEMGLFNEIIDRIMMRSLPIPPGEDDLGEVFNQFFPERSDAEWIERLDQDVLQQIFAFCAYEVDEDEFDWNTLLRDMEEALMILVGQVETTGLSFSIRKRLSSRRIQDIPFYQLSRVTHEVIKTFGMEDVGVIRQQIKHYRSLLEICRDEVHYAYEHLSDFGVSLNIVYQLDRLEAQLSRIGTLVDILVSEEIDQRRVARFVAALIRESYERHHIMPLLSENLSILSRRIADRHAETGEGYFTRTVPEYFRMLKKAGGGGIVTGFTVFSKELIYLLHLSHFWNGFFLASSYASSFVLIQFSHCTLATKQPAMTAPALAAKMHALNDESVFGSLVREIINLIRSQSAAIFGNVLLVIPTVLLIFAFSWNIFGWEIMDEARARKVISEYSILGWTPFFAVFTGCLLWVSSVIAGLVDNWLAYRQVPTALGSSRKLRQLFGQNGAAKLGRFIGKHGTGLAGNISLGVLLGLVPQFFYFVGINLDVRHVTLASGSVTMAVASLGFEVLSEPRFWLAAMGIVLIGVLNVSVSFGLALAVAMKARRINTPDRKKLYFSLARRVLRNPLAIFFPFGLSNAGEKFK